MLRAAPLLRTAAAATLPSAAVATSCARAKHTLPDLPYDFSALEPVVSADIMKIHHQKHHAAYVTNLNAAEERLAEAIGKNDLSAALALQPALRFNGGGHINHSIFWTNLCKGGSGMDEDLKAAITAEFGGVDGFVTKMNAASVGVQGSGWGWLGYNKASQRLQLATCPNQDPLEATTGLVPLLGIDVWEHAYYLQYKNMRADYLKNIWDVVNWKNVGERFAKAKQ